jgi:hypothetical protein
MGKGVVEGNEVDASEGGRRILLGGTLLQDFMWEMKPLWRKGSPQYSHILKADIEEVQVSCTPGAQSFHSIRIDFRICSPSLASERKQVPQAVHVKGRRGEWSVGGIGIRVGSWGGRGVVSACSSREG